MKRSGKDEGSNELVPTRRTRRGETARDRAADGSAICFATGPVKTGLVTNDVTGESWFALMFREMGTKGLAPVEVEIHDRTGWLAKAARRCHSRHANQRVAHPERGVMT